MIDDAETPFGVRTIRFDPDTGFFLNAQPLKLKGVCMHHDAGSLGAAVPDKVWERRLRALKELGVNAIRTSHNPPAPELLDLCDRLGFLVKDEAFDEFTPTKNKWVTGRNDGEPSRFGYGEIFAEWSVTDIRATWSGATATTRRSSCGASATRLTTRTIRSRTRCSARTTGRRTRRRRTS